MHHLNNINLKFFHLHANYILVTSIQLYLLKLLSL